MTATELQHYLHTHIPLSQAMAVEVLSVEEERVILCAPLGPNINHRETVFGGSASAVAILAAWSLLHTRLVRLGLPSRIVIQKNTMQYRRPIFGTFTATSRMADPAEWQKFLRMLERKGIARVSVASALDYAGEAVGEFEGEFVALAGREPSFG